MTKTLFSIIIMVFLFSCSEKSKNKIEKVELDLPSDTIPWSFSLIRKTYDKVLIPALDDSIISLSEGEIIDRQFGHLCAQDTLKAKEYVLLFAEMYKKGLKPKTPKEFYPAMKYANDSIYHLDENFYSH